MGVNNESVTANTARIMREVSARRIGAHAKHGKNSIESVPADDIARWLPILGEEFGEVCESLTYDKDKSNLRSEIMDLITVGVAWVSAIDKMEKDAAIPVFWGSGLSKTRVGNAFIVNDSINLTINNSQAMDHLLGESMGFSNITVGTPPEYSPYT